MRPTSIPRFVDRHSHFLQTEVRHPHSLAQTQPMTLRQPIRVTLERMQSRGGMELVQIHGFCAQSLK